MVIGSDSFNKMSFGERASQAFDYLCALARARGSSFEVSIIDEAYMGAALDYLATAFGLGSGVEGSLKTFS